MITKIKDIWEDFRYIDEGSFPKYFINQCIWGIWFVLFVASLSIAAFLGDIIFKAQVKWYKFRGKDYVKDVLQKRHGL